MFIDADAHVIECPDTWDYFPQSMSDYRPAAMSFNDGATPRYLEGLPTQGIMFDGQLFRQPINTDVATGTTADIREMRDIPGRLKDMDRLGIATQILYPTMLLSELTRRAELEVGICEAYNRWIADRCGESGGRLRWTATLPTRSIPDALREMRWAKEHGAVGIFRRGYEAEERRACDPYFYPLYDLAQELDLPICFHIARPYSGHHQAMVVKQKTIFGPSYTIDAFLAILIDGTWRKYPELRFGFIEIAASWLSYALWLGQFENLNTSKRSEIAGDTYNRVLDDARLFVTCEVTEDLPALVELVGDNRLFVGSDYGHADRATYVEAHQKIAERADLKPDTVEKLTTSNAALFYGLDSAS